MASNVVNVLVSGLPRSEGGTANHVLPLPTTTTTAELWDELYERLPSIEHRLILSSPRHSHIPYDEDRTIGDYLQTPEQDLLSLNLWIPLLGGKGGFGSQLRAAGGRMSSKRKKNQGEDNGSSRNLDGRRLRTVTEAKALAEYLAIKPDMERKEKERRRKRWEQIVEIAEKKEEDIKHGGRGRLDGRWVEDKEEASERTRAAVLAAMKSGTFTDVGSGLHELGTSAASNTSASASADSASGSNNEDESEESEESEEGEGSDSAPEPESSSAAAAAAAAVVASSASSQVNKSKGKGKVFFAFDEDDEFMSSDESESEETGKK